jgi:hypothetical protein
MDRQPRSQEQEIENVLSGAAEPAESVDDSRDWERELENIIGGAAEAVFESSDEEIEAELRSWGEDPDAVAEEVRGVRAAQPSSWRAVRFATALSPSTVTPVDSPLLRLVCGRLVRFAVVPAFPRTRRRLATWYRSKSKRTRWICDLIRSDDADPRDGGATCNPLVDNTASIL